MIRRIQELSTVPHVKDVEQAIKTLQNEWDETGPVGNDAWESLKNSYWDAVRAVYARIQVFYDEKRTELASNLEQKKEIAKKAADLVKDFASSNSKDWDSATATLLALQEEWKKIGFGPRKENEEVWKEFRAACDEFFAKKKLFFDSIREKFDDIAFVEQDEPVLMIQTKHQLYRPGNLSNTSVDLWRTIKSWCDVERHWPAKGY